MYEGIKIITEIQPLNYDLFVGIDVDTKSNVVTIMDHYMILESKKFPYNPDNLLSFIHKRYPDKKIVFAYETGPTGWNLFDAITDAGYVCLVTPPNKIPDEKNRKVKTNRIDSRKISNQLRGGNIEGVRVPSHLYREFRHLTSLRRTFRKEVTRFKIRIKSLLCVESIPFPASYQSSWTLEVLLHLKTDNIYDKVRPKLDFLINALEYNVLQLKRSIKLIHAFCKKNTDISESIEYLKSMPGIGYISAYEILSRIGDWRLLKNSKEVGSFLGLTPYENSTGEKIIRGEITKQGSAYLRSLLIECSWVAIRRDEELKLFYNKIFKRNPLRLAPKKAIVAVARKMSARIYHVLKYRHNYQIKNILKKVA